MEQQQDIEGRRRKLDTDQPWRNLFPFGTFYPFISRLTHEIRAMADGNRERCFTLGTAGHVIYFNSGTSHITTLGTSYSHGE